MTAPGGAGFTLVELLIAIALIGMLTVLAYGDVQFGNLSWHHANLVRNADAELVAIRQVLGRSIANAYPAYASGDLADTKIAFDGAAETLDLVAPLPEAFGPGLMAAERFAVDRRSKPALVMSWRLNLPAATGGALPVRTVPLAQSVATIRFAYFGRQKQDQTAAWYDKWSGMRWLPELIRVRVWREGVPDRAWLDFAVEPKLTTNVACAYDQIGPECRRQQ